MSVEVITSVVVAIGGSAGVAALFKLRPEIARVTVSAAEGAVIVQKGVIESLKQEIQRLHEDLERERQECEERDKEKEQIIGLLRDEVANLRTAFSRIDERRSERRDRGRNG